MIIKLIVFAKFLTKSINSFVSLLGISSLFFITFVGDLDKVRLN